jgi:hypothetical protein
MSAKNHRSSISLRDRDQALSAIERELQIIEHVTGIATLEMQRSNHTQIDFQRELSLKHGKGALRMERL